MAVSGFNGIWILHFTHSDDILKGFSVGRNVQKSSIGSEVFSIMADMSSKNIRNTSIHEN